MRRTPALLSGLGLFLAASAGLTGCGHKEPDAPATAATIVTVSKPLEREVADYEDFTGRTAAVEVVEVKPHVWGYLIGVHFNEGAEVNKGDLLYEIDPRPYQADLDQALASLRVAQAQVKFAESDYARYVRLSAMGSASQEDVDKARQAQDVARAQVEAQRATIEARRIDLGFTRITAPISGKISRTQITAGNLVQASSGGATLLTTLVSLDPVYAYFNVDERTVLNIQQMIREGKVNSAMDETRNKAFAAANMLGALLCPAGNSPLLAGSGLFPGRKFPLVPVWIGLGTEKGFPHKGYIDFVDNQVDASTGTLAVRGLFFNKQRILSPGLFVRVRVLIGVPHKALLVTERALATDQEQKFVYVVNARNEVEPRPVTLGGLHDGLREIIGGLDRNETVIINGLQRVRPGVTVNPKPGNMLSFTASGTR